RRKRPRINKTSRRNPIDQLEQQVSTQVTIQSSMRNGSRVCNDVLQRITGEVDEARASTHDVEANSEEFLVRRSAARILSCVTITTRTRSNAKNRLSNMYFSNRPVDA